LANYLTQMNDVLNLETDPEKIALNPYHIGLFEKK
jgi:hypothetical protein